MAGQATIKAPAAISACILFLVIGAAIGYLFAGPGGAAGNTGEEAGEPGSSDAEFVFENPLRPVTVGEWVTYERGGGNQLRWEVVGVDGATGAVSIQKQEWDPDINKVVSATAASMGPNHFFLSHDGAGYVVTQIFPERIEAAGRQWSCLCIEMVSGRLGVVRSWYSPEVPVAGLVRQRVAAGPSKGRVLAELTDWSGR